MKIAPHQAVTEGGDAAKGPDDQIVREGGRHRTADEILRAFVAAFPIDGDFAVSEALELLAERTGKNKYRHAAAIVRDKKVGRHEKDDRWALQQIADCSPERRREAVGKVAKKVARSGATAKDIAAIERRLRRKIKRTKLFCPSEQAATSEP